MHLKEIKDLMRSFDKSGLNKLKIKDGDFEIAFQKGVAIQSTTQVSQVVSEPQPVAVLAENESPKEANAAQSDALYITSPMVGTFYQAPSPGAPAFVQVGDSVKKGSTVAIIEAMKIMNEIESEFDCKILEVLVSDGEPVEFDQPLFRVEKI